MGLYSYKNALEQGYGYLSLSEHIVWPVTQLICMYLVDEMCGMKSSVGTGEKTPWNPNQSLQVGAEVVAGLKVILTQSSRGTDSRKSGGRRTQYKHTAHSGGCYIDEMRRFCWAYRAVLPEMAAWTSSQLSLHWFNHLHSSYNVLLDKVSQHNRV